VTVGLLAIMLDEAGYVDRWAETIKRAKAFNTPFDQVIVVDGGSSDDTVKRLRAWGGVTVITRAFSNDYAAQRNFGIEQCRTDWICELDADESLSAPLLAGLRVIAVDAERDRVDCVGIPRLNFIDDVLVAGPGHRGLDYQYRLHRRSCYWRGVVHEEIDGYQARVELAIEDGHFITHSKSSERHMRQNEYYRTLAP
jgi:glycosyltransferase involved in cell wall biosynthesis